MFIHNAWYVAALGIFTPATDTACHLWAGLYRDFGIDNQQLQDAIAIMAPLARSSTRLQTTIPTGERHSEHPRRTVSAYPRIRRQGVPHAANR